jgi:hypothetical protein
VRRGTRDEAPFAMNWHIEVIAAKLAAVRESKIQRPIINLPPRHLKSLMASVAFPAWCLGHDPSAQILCVSYARDLADMATVYYIQEVRILLLKTTTIAGIS